MGFAVKNFKITDVARLAGVSPATVSNVINGRHERMSGDTFERVREVVEQLGFRPNAMARQLKTGNLPMLGLLVPSIANPFFGSLAREVEEAARKRGYGLLLCNSRRDAERELEYADALLAQGVRGVILGAALRAQEHLPKLRERGLAVLGFDRHDADGAPTIDTVSIDNFKAAYLATKHLCGLRHRSLVYVTGALTSANRVARLEGFQAACAKHGVQAEVREIEAAKLFSDEEMAQGGKVAGERLVAEGHPATGVVAMNDMAAIGAIAGLHAGGRVVPTQMSVIGIDDVFLAAYCLPGLSTVHQPLPEMAESAVAQLIARIGDPQLPISQKLFQPKLMLRGSTAKPGKP